MLVQGVHNFFRIQYTVESTNTGGIFEAEKNPTFDLFLFFLVRKRGLTIATDLTQLIVFYFEEIKR